VTVTFVKAVMAAHADRDLKGKSERSRRSWRPSGVSFRRSGVLFGTDRDAIV
jgi:hypothetical protein